MVMREVGMVVVFREEGRVGLVEGEVTVLALRLRVPLELMARERWGGGVATTQPRHHSQVLPILYREWFI